MSESILTSTKKVLGVAEDYIAFDLDITTHINATLAAASQMGVGVEDFFVVDASQTWADLGLPKHIENMLRSYVYLKVRILFDPPATSFLRITRLRTRFHSPEL